MSPDGWSSVGLAASFWAGHADYSFDDQGWRPVEGVVTVPSVPFTVVAARDSTVFVAEDCLANFLGPGC